MNQIPENKEADQIRSDIETTRERMDNTIDALGERLKGRHLVDEVIGFFRSSSDDPESTGSQIKEKATSALHSVVDTVKANPVPALMIGGGIAWLIYETRRGHHPNRGFDQYDPTADFYRPEDYDRPLEYPAPGESDFNDFPAGYREGAYPGHTAASEYPTEGAGGKFERAKENVREKLSAAGEAVQEKFSHARDSVRESAETVRRRAGEIGSRVQQRTREVYQQGRRQVVRTANEHPLELGAALLAVGLIAGLALPTPRKINEIAGPTADRLRQRARNSARNLAQRGQSVAQAAKNAVREEAEKQGLTFDSARHQNPNPETSVPPQSGAPSSEQNPPSQSPSI